MGKGRNILMLLAIVMLVQLQFCADCNLKSYGAPYNDKKKDTEAVKKAIKDCPGGKIIFPKGRYSLKPFNFTTGQTLYLENGAYLLAVTGLDDWQTIPSFPSYGEPTELQYESFISTWDSENVTITGDGEGVIDGNGLVWWERKNRREIRINRGRLVEFVNCRNIEVSKVHLRYSPFWTLHLYNSWLAHLHDFNIFNTLSPNTDGIDIDSTSFVVIERVRITTQDDHICVKSGYKKYGWEFGVPSHNILIQDCLFEMGAGVAIGTEMAGNVRNVVVKNSTFSIVANAVRMKSTGDMGGIVENVLFENLYVKLAYSLINFNLAYKDGPATAPPVFRNITVRNVNGFTIKSGTLACYEKSHCKQITVENYNAWSLYGIACQYVEDNEGLRPKWCTS